MAKPSLFDTRLMTAMVTPFDGDLAIDFAGAAKMARHLCDSGSDGIVVCGTTGEAPTLSREEKLEMVEVIAKAVGDRALIVAGTGSYDTKAAISMSREAQARGADAVLVISPYYNKPNQAGLLAHFTAVAQAVDVPVILYNHPGRTGVTIEASTMAALARVPNIVAVKDSSGSLDLVTSYRMQCPPEFLIYSGDDPLTLPVLAVGGHGVISVTSHVAGPVIAAMLAAWRRGDTAEARRLHEATFVLSKALFCAPSPGPVKAALQQRGFDVGGVRLPLVWPTEDEVATVVAALEGLAVTA